MSRRDRLSDYVEDNGRAIGYGAAVNAVFYLPALGFAVAIVFAGAIGGWITGHMTHRYGPALRNGAAAGALGAAIPTFVLGVVGGLSQFVVGPNLVASVGTTLVYGSPIFLPLFAVEGAVGAIAASWFSKAGRN